MITLKQVLSRSKQTLVRLGPKRFYQPSIPHGFQPRTDLEEFYLNGFLWKKLERNQNLEKLNSILKEIKSGNIKPPFELKEKTPNYFIFRPKLFNYDDVFMDILFDNHIPQLVREVTEKDLFLAELSLMHHKPTHQNDWHRDTYIYNGKQIGPFPPICKMIYYPTLGAAPEPRIEVIPGSHRRVFFDRATDESQIRRSNKRTIYSSDEHILLFDASILHAVCPDTNPEGSYRVHYLFARENQIDDERYPDHRDLLKKYKSRLYEPNN